MTSIKFANTSALTATTTTPRAEGDLLLVGTPRTKDQGFGDVLIDSGSDYVVLPVKAGFDARLALPPRPTTSLGGVGGSVPVTLVKNVALEFEKHAIRADVMFDYSNSVKPLFGRSGIQALKELGIDRNDWHWNP